MFKNGSVRLKILYNFVLFYSLKKEKNIIKRMTDIEKLIKRATQNVGTITLWVRFRLLTYLNNSHDEKYISNQARNIKKINLLNLLNYSLFINRIILHK